MLITQSYREINKRMHATHEDYGAVGHLYAPFILDLARGMRTEDVLDYGCGKMTLQAHIPFPLKHFDPCIEGLDMLPEPADLVACTDVMEHIEPECLDDVLTDLRRVTRHCAFITVCTVEAKKFLDDGRNTHLIQQPAIWWLNRFCTYFQLELFKTMGPTHFVVLLK
jgi:hypothetical protein